MTSIINEIADNIKIVDIPELLHKKLWEYKAEGRANLVVAYRGKNVKYNGVVLRVRKITLEEYEKNQQNKQRIIFNEHHDANNNNDNDNDNDDDDVIVENLDNEKPMSYNAIDKLQIYNLLYSNFIINNFLGKRFSGMNMLLKLNPTFLENLNRYIYPVRPESRRTIDRIDNEQYYGTLSLDYTKVKRTQTFIPASIITTSLDINIFNSLNNESLSNINSSQQQESTHFITKEQNNKNTQNSQPEINSSNDSEITTLSSTIIKSKPQPIINRDSSTISVHVTNIPGLESKLLFAEPIENTNFSESESESTSLTNPSSVEALTPLTHFKSKQLGSKDDISKCIDKLTDEIIILNKKENDQIQNQEFINDVNNKLKKVSTLYEEPESMNDNINTSSSKIKLSNSISLDQKSSIRKNKQKKENNSNSFILRPIENHPLLSEKSLSKTDINKLLQQYQNQTNSLIDNSSSNFDSQINNLNSQDNNKNISMIIPNQNLISLNNNNQQFKIAIPEAQSIAIELKPKWGFKPNPKTNKFSNPKSFIKYDYCRFCLHYLFKNREKIESDPLLNCNKIHPLLKNHFCPLDLYSGDEFRTRKAIDSLYNSPGNNLKLFINGKQINLKELNKDKKENEKEKENQKKDKKSKKDQQNSDHLIENLVDFFHCNKEMIKPVFCDFFTHLILQEHELFQRLKFHQSHLDSLDIEKIIQFYESFIEKNYKIEKNSLNNKNEMKEPTIEDWFFGFEKYKEKIKSIPSAKKYTNFKPSEMDSLKDNDNNNNNHNINNNDNYTDEEKIQYILEFLISKTLKDCSILIAVQSIEESNNLEDGSISINTPLLMTQSTDSSKKSFINSHLSKKLNKKDSIILKQGSILNTTSTKVSIPTHELSNTSSQNEESHPHLNFDQDKENYREITINDKKYRYNIHVVDLDSKSIKKIPNYFKLDKNIVDCYTKYKESFGECRETKCID